MTLTSMVNAATNRQPVTSQVVQICIDWFGGKSLEVQAAINRASNEEKAAFIKQLLATIAATRESDATKSGVAKQELIELLGDGILRHPAIAPSGSARMIFSLTQTGEQFRGWYGPFGEVTPNFFDSCGIGIIFSATCEDRSILRQWLRAIVCKDEIEWRSPGFGSVWLGYNRRGLSF